MRTYATALLVGTTLLLAGAGCATPLQQTVSNASDTLLILSMTEVDRWMETRLGPGWDPYRALILQSLAESIRAFVTEFVTATGASP
jgi:hypothetical protein